MNTNPFNREHGSLFDRGQADAYYRRKPDPHWFPNGTGIGEKILAKNELEIEEYMIGYRTQTTFKEW